KMPDDAKPIYQAMADDYHARFIKVVRESRSQLKGDPAVTFDGRPFTASQALERGLIDRIGYLEDAVALAMEMGQAPGAGLILYRRCNDPAHSLYAVSANWPVPIASTGISLPGLDRTRLPAFLYLCRPEARLEKVTLK